MVFIGCSMHLSLEEECEGVSILYSYVLLCTYVV